MKHVKSDTLSNNIFKKQNIYSRLGAIIITLIIGLGLFFTFDLSGSQGIFVGLLVLYIAHGYTSLIMLKATYEATLVGVIESIEEYVSKK